MKIKSYKGKRMNKVEMMDGNILTLDTILILSPSLQYLNEPRIVSEVSVGIRGHMGHLVDGVEAIRSLST